MKSNLEKMLMYFSNVEHNVISQLTKFEIQSQLVREETKKKNIIRG